MPYRSFKIFWICCKIKAQCDNLQNFFEKMKKSAGLRKISLSTTQIGVLLKNAIEERNDDELKLLLDEGALVADLKWPVSCGGYQFDTMINYVAYAGSVNALKWISDACPLEEPKLFANSTIHWVLVRWHNLQHSKSAPEESQIAGQKISFILENSKNPLKYWPEIIDRFNEFPLFEGLIKAFSAHQADVDQLTPSGRSLFCFAISRSNEEFVKTLLELGAKPNKICVKTKDFTLNALELAQKYSNEKIKQMILAKNEYNVLMESTVLSPIKKSKKAL